jgi:hypothetical protein
MNAWFERKCNGLKKSQDARTVSLDGDQRLCDCDPPDKVPKQDDPSQTHKAVKKSKIELGSRSI